MNEDNMNKWDDTDKWIERDIPPVLDKLAEALAAAQGEMENAATTHVNPHFRSKYADLASIRTATIPALSKHGLAIIQTIEPDGNGAVLITRLAHKSGQFTTSVYRLPAWHPPQAFGSALTYARRYSWAAMCGIAQEEEDDDANTAQSSSVPAKPMPKPEPRPLKIATPVKASYQTPATLPEDENDALAFGRSYIQAIRTATSLSELEQWSRLNTSGLSRLKNGDSRAYNHLLEAVRRRSAEVAKPEELAGSEGEVQ